ncbi:MAG: type 4a pilus biogenesis protein PilO [Peptococcaceae bacterium]|nr:type 4a pilus biogenesis protein PilO [Peptococcaceae bacterium]
MQAIAQQAINLFWKMANDRVKLLKGVGVLIFVVLTVYLAAPGVKAATQSRQNYIAMKTSYDLEKAKASNISARESELASVTAEFETLSKNLSRDISTGVAVAEIARFCGENGVELLSLQPGEQQEAVYKNHLRAVPVKMKISGPFPAILKTMKAIESSGNPSEFRDIKIDGVANEQAAGNVTAELTTVLYSLNPPGTVEYVTAPSGSYDPFWALKTPPVETVPAQQNGINLPLVNQVLPGGAKKQQDQQSSQQPVSQQVQQFPQQLPPPQPAENQKSLFAKVDRCLILTETS